MGERGGLTAPPSSPQSPAAPSRRWDDVPDDILVRVSAFLPCRADRAHMACANPRWSAAVRGIGRPAPPELPPLPPLPPQLPWLIFPSTAAPIFYSPIADCYHRIGGLPPDVRRARCCGSGDGGWLVLAFDDGLAPHAHALYNLDSGRRVPFPPAFVPTPASANGDRTPFDMRVAALSSSAPYKVAAVVLADGAPTPAFWTEGCQWWGSPGPLHNLGLQDAIFDEDRFYFLTSGENVIEVFVDYSERDAGMDYAIEDLEIEQRWDYDQDIKLIRGNGTMKRYLVPSRGDLLMVVRYVFDHDEGTRPAVDLIRVFELFYPPRINCVSPEPFWRDLLGDLDGRMLFLGPGCSRSFEVDDYDIVFEESMIYFLDEGLVSEPTEDGRGWFLFTDMGRFSTAEMHMAAEPWPEGHPQGSDNAPPTWWLH